MTSSETGKTGENAVCEYLEKQGYTIAVRNYRIKGGEIDIIAVNSYFTAFVEVKSRRPDCLVTGFEAVDERKKRLIVKTASDYCMKYPSDLQPRFDIAQVTVENGRVLGIEYIENAYDTTGFNFIF